MMLSLLLTFFAYASEPKPLRYAKAEVEVTRSYITFQLDRLGEIRKEIVCKQTLEIPVYDFLGRSEERAKARSAELNCPSLYRDLKVPVQVAGRIELLEADDFGLGLPEGRAVKRTYFSLSVEIDSSFPYLSEVQELTGWQLFTEDLSLRSQIFLLSPTNFLSIHCGTLGCSFSGSQSVYRATVNLNDLTETE